MKPWRRNWIAGGVCCLLMGACGERLTSIERIETSQIAVAGIAFAQGSFVRGTQATQFLLLDAEAGSAHMYFSVDSTQPENGPQWVSAPAGPQGVTLETLSAVRDSAGVFHMAALDRTHADLYYGAGASDAIVWRNVFPGYDVVSAVAPIVLDQQGSPWIFFANQTSATIESIHILADATASRATIALGGAAALAGGFDASGRAYVVWAGTALPASVNVSVRSDAGWNTGRLWEGVADAIDFVADAAVDDVFLSYPRAVWHDADRGDLVYAEQVSSSGWVVETVDSPGQVGVAPRLIADAQGRSWIVHLDRNELNLRGSRQGSSEGWYNQTLDAVGATGLWPDLAVDATGNVRMLYFRADARTVILRRWGLYD